MNDEKLRETIAFEHVVSLAREMMDQLERSTAHLRCEECGRELNVCNREAIEREIARLRSRV